MPAEALELRDLADLFRALGDETRLAIVALLANGELCVCHIHEALGLGQPHVSRHLAILRRAGIVADRRDGTWVHYRLVEQDDPERARVLAATSAAFARKAGLRRDLARVKRACGPGAAP